MTTSEGTPVNLLEQEYRMIITNATGPIKGVDYDSRKYQVYFAFGTRIDRMTWRGTYQEMFMNSTKSMFQIFSSPEQNAQVSYCDRSPSVVRRASSVNFYIFDFFSKTHGQILTKLDMNHP